MLPADQPTPAPTARAATVQRRARTRRIIKTLLIVDLLVLVAAASIWYFVLRDGSSENAVNPGLRGSKPPAGQTWPALASTDGLTPPFPTRRDVAGSATMLVATCIDCRSGDIIGGFLGRMAADALPRDARVVVLGWNGNVQSWATQWNIDATRFELHAVEPDDDAALAQVRAAVGIAPVQDAEESGIAFLYDPKGSWRSTFFIGQLKVDDIAHDLSELDG